MKIENVEIQKLVPYEKNPRGFIEDKELVIKKIASSIENFGITQPIVCNQDYVVCIGHTRLEAMKHLGLKTVPVLKLNIDDDRFAALNIADNKSHEFTSWDFDKLYKTVANFSEDIGKMTLFDVDDLAIDNIMEGPDRLSIDNINEESPNPDEPLEDEGPQEPISTKKNVVFITLVYDKEEANEFRECIKETLEGRGAKSKEELILKLLQEEREEQDEPDDGKEYYNKTLTEKANDDVFSKHGF